MVVTRIVPARLHAMGFLSGFSGGIKRDSNASSSLNVCASCLSMAVNLPWLIHSSISQNTVMQIESIMIPRRNSTEACRAVTRLLKETRPNQFGLQQYGPWTS